ncbi:O-antigen ligase family protein [Barnesiella viscericola]|uniref:O-antigen ligase family protein n=2 Tax=Barnesiella TaxID=397864 RepID=UPI0025A413B4|nr:O-antigen ligase family protein [Barnesiella viscericola]MDM8268533.1 O-antigen ligase family protein [Barnesiella viscericola]
MLWFQSSDELITLLMALLCMLDMLANKNHQRYKGLFAVVGVMTFYLLYSMFALHYNTPKAILYDFFIQIKPFIAFYAAYSMGVRFDASQKQFLKRLCVFLSGLMLLIILSGFGMKFFFHVAHYGIISTVLFLIYYYCSYQNLTKRDKIVMMLLLAVGFFSTRSKFYGFFVVAMYIFFWYKPGILVRVKLKQWITIALVFCVVLYVAWGKINYYFISSGLFTGSEDQKDSFARAILYVRSPEILMDHFVFGSGLASYATYSSGDVGYSRVYENYNIENVWGLQEGDCPFVSDTFFPELVQFGIVGIILFFYFWVWVYRKIKPRDADVESLQLYKIGLLIIAFATIESVAGSAFLQGSGIIVMILLGFVVRDVSILKERHAKSETRIERV